MNVVITGGRRTAIGAFLGAFKDTSAIELATTATTPLLGGLECNDIADVIVGNVLQVGLGMNAARQIALASGLPVTVPGQTINRVCGSGMQAVIAAAQAIHAGEGALYVAGGTESMSCSPHLLARARTGYRLGNAEVLDSMVHDGLTDLTHRYHMGVTAENVATRWKIDRQRQDEFAFESHQRASEAQAAGVFLQEIAPVEVSKKKQTVRVTNDEGIRPDTSIEALSLLRPVFQKDGMVTAGNASSLNDGAAMLVVAEQRYASDHSLPILGHVLSYAAVGVDPALMGIGPAMAIPLALRRANLTTEDIDLFELNEAFASQSLAVIQHLHLDSSRVNINGGAIALGHPIGASGARILVTLLHAIRSRGKSLGVASLCIGGGMGIAMVVQAGKD